MSAGLYVRGARQVESLTGEIRRLEATNAQLRSDYETTIARLKAELAARPSAPATPPGRSLLETLGRAPGGLSPQREAVLPQMSAALGLDPAQQVRVRAAIDAFARARAGVLARAQAEQRSVLEARYLDMLSQARAETLAELKRVFTDAQYSAFVGQGFDRALGLRLAGPADRGAGSGG